MRVPSWGWDGPLEKGMYSCLENPMDRGAQWVQSTGLHRVGTRLKLLSTHAWHTVKNYVIHKEAGTIF